MRSGSNLQSILFARLSSKLVRSLRIIGNMVSNGMGSRLLGLYNEWYEKVRTIEHHHDARESFHGLQDMVPYHNDAAA